MFETELDHIRKISHEMGCFSWTSREYQDDILRHLIQNRDRGCGVIEVGCYKGGLSALLAFLCKEFNWPFYTIDIDATAIASTQNLLSTLNLLDGATLHHGTLSSFVQVTALKAQPALIILDGDHRYEAVIDDIVHVYRLNERPLSAVFHDFSLRHPTSGEKVDIAVEECFGKSEVKRIGARMDGSDTYPTKEKPSSDGHWWEVPGSEGAIVTLPASLNPAVIRAATPVEITPPSQPSLVSRILRRLGVR